MKKQFVNYVVAVFTVACAIPSGVLAASLDVRIKSENDLFRNEGTMSATQVTHAGSGSQILALRARNPVTLDIHTEYNSKNNRYINSGKMTAVQTNSAGAGSQVVALEAY